MNPLSFVCLWFSIGFADLLGLPTVPFSGSSDATFDIRSVRSITVDQSYANATDEAGSTLIPPTLQEFAEVFAGDLRSEASSHVDVCSGAESTHGAIFLTVGNSSEFVDVAGRFTAEAYRLEVSEEGVTITGASPLGVWWGTRTVLQQAVLHDGQLTVGSGTDAPGWATRGVMLDVGRHYYPPDFVVDMCSWMSYWKQNTFHIHLSDNIYDNADLYSREEQLSLYARFRLLSDDPAVEGLNKYPNESYTRGDFEHIQHSCAARGVTVLPEIEAPYHALVISQWRPELGLDGNFDLLNLSNPDTVPAVKSIWQTFLPWFHTKLVHIGADEYVVDGESDYELGEAYNDFVAELDDYIRAESGKEVRIWGTYPPQANYTNNIDRSVSIQHWAFFEDNPLEDYIQNGYDVLNSADNVYIVAKHSESYGQTLNRTWIFIGNPEGGPFAPNIFDTQNPGNNSERSSPHVLGHIAPQWNDYGPNATTYLEGYHAWRGNLPALADKQWGGNLLESDYDALFAALQPRAPAQNLDRTVASTSAGILHYDFTGVATPHAGLDLPKGRQIPIEDLSANNLTAQTSCAIYNSTLHLRPTCGLTTPLTSLSSPYTLFLSLRRASHLSHGPILTGADSQLLSGNGSSNNVMLVAAGNAFALNYTLPVGEWVDLQLIGRGNQTFLSVGGEEMEFSTKVGINGVRNVWRGMAIEAPVERVGGGGWVGEVGMVELRGEA